MPRPRARSAAAPLVAVAVFASLACSKPAPHAGEPSRPCDVPTRELELERALPIEGRALEPSGLLYGDGKLLMVSDKRDDAVFELILGEAVAEARVSVPLASMGAGPLDLEGLTHEVDGSWLLVSEAQARVLHVAKSGAATWVTPALRSIGDASGLLKKPGAGLEGIARLEDGRLLLAAEREPRGLLESDERRERWQSQAMPSTICPPPLARPSDWADLTVAGGRVFGLARNSHQVVELQQANGRWREGAAFSYAQTENDPRFAYQDRRFGLGEGLALSEHHLYVVLDNNGTARAAEPGDHRPLLLIFRKPD